jgi:hypothetical protein
MKLWYKWQNDPKEIKIADFAGPVWIAVGIIMFFNVFTLSTNSISFELAGWLSVNLAAAIIMILLGSWEMIVHHTKKGFARLGIVSGFSIFSWGVRVLNIIDYQNIVVWIIVLGWSVVIFGAICVYCGIKWSRKNNFM